MRLTEFQQEILLEFERFGPDQTADDLNILDADHTPEQLRRNIAKLRKLKLLESDNGRNYSLTAAGRDAAVEIRVAQEIAAAMPPPPRAPAPAAPKNRPRKSARSSGGCLMPLLRIAFVLGLVAIIINTCTGCAAVVNADNLSPEQIRAADLPELKRAWQTVVLDLSEPAYVAQLRSAAIAKHPEWSQEACDVISRGQIMSGFTMEQVWWAWGRPAQTDISDSPAGRFDRWWYIYNGKGWYTTHVTFENAVVIWWRTDTSTY